MVTPVWCQEGLALVERAAEEEVVVVEAGFFSPLACA
jgi:hypothetical protein